LGGSAEGYRLLTDLGCQKTPLFPSIVQLRTATDFVRAVKGIRVDAALRLSLNGKTVAKNIGEVLFTDYGLSGPAVMQISRPVGDWERQKKGEMVAHLDLLPDWDEKKLVDRIRQRRLLAGRTMEDLLTGLTNKRVGQTILRVAGVLPLTRETGTLTDDEAARVAATLKDWRLTVTGTQGFGGAQVTAGGIDAAEVSDTFADRTDPSWPTFWFAPKLTGKGAFRDVYSVMSNWGSNHSVTIYGHVGNDILTLCSMLRIPVTMHNVEEERIFRPHVWSGFGTDNLEAADMNACMKYGPLYQ